MPVLFLLEGAFVLANVKLSMFGPWHPVWSFKQSIVCSCLHWAWFPMGGAKLSSWADFLAAQGPGAGQKMSRLQGRWLVCFPSQSHMCKSVPEYFPDLSSQWGLTEVRVSISSLMRGKCQLVSWECGGHVANPKTVTDTTWDCCFLSRVWDAGWSTLNSREWGKWDSLGLRGVSCISGGMVFAVPQASAAGKVLCLSGKMAAVILGMILAATPLQLSPNSFYPSLSSGDFSTHHLPSDNTWGECLRSGNGVLRAQPEVQALLLSGATPTVSIALLTLSLPLLWPGPAPLWPCPSCQARSGFCPSLFESLLSASLQLLVQGEYSPI